MAGGADGGRALAASSTGAWTGASFAFASPLPGSGSNISITGGAASAACFDAREREGFGAEGGAAGAASGETCGATSTATGWGSAVMLPFATASGAEGRGASWASALRPREDGAEGGTARISVEADGAGAPANEADDEAGAAGTRRRTGADDGASGTPTWPTCDGEAEGTARALGVSMSRPDEEGRGPGGDGRATTSMPASWPPASPSFPRARRFTTRPSERTRSSTTSGAFCRSR